MIDEILVDETQEVNEEALTNDENHEEMMVQKETKENEKANIKFGNVLTRRKTKVFAKINDDGYVINVQSDAVLEDPTGWVQIDEGYGDRFVFAHTEYFDKPIIDEDGNYQIKLEK